MYSLEIEWETSLEVDDPLRPASLRPECCFTGNFRSVDRPDIQISLLFMIASEKVGPVSSPDGSYVRLHEPPGKSH